MSNVEFVITSAKKPSLRPGPTLLKATHHVVLPPPVLLAINIHPTSKACTLADVRPMFETDITPIFRFSFGVLEIAQRERKMSTMLIGKKSDLL